MKKTAVESCGFSLTEVLLALGVLSFSVLSMMGLFSIAINASQESSRKTALAAMATTVASQWRAVSSPADRYYFDALGHSVPETSAVYECSVHAKALSDGVIFEVDGGMTLLTLSFTWPASSPVGSRPNSATLYATVVQ